MSNFREHLHFEQTDVPTIIRKSIETMRKNYNNNHNESCNIAATLFFVMLSYKMCLKYITTFSLFLFSSSCNKMFQKNVYDVRNIIHKTRLYMQLTHPHK